MKAKIFAYKGNVGVEMDTEDGKFINDPTSPGQLGAVIDATEVLITKEAKETIRHAGREGGSFAELMLTEHADGSGASVGVLGYGKVHLGSDFKIGRDCQLSVLDKIEEIDEEAPQDYKDFVDGQ